jgi:hypothetical protein
MATYIPVRNRNDMTSRQYYDYLSDWNTFQRIWVQDYIFSTMGTGETYDFSSYKELQSYNRGRDAHINVYDLNSPGRILSTIHVHKNILAPANQFTSLR